MDELSICLSLVALTACLAHGGWLTIGLATGRPQIPVSSQLTALSLSAALLLAVATNWVANDSFPSWSLDQMIVLLAVAGWLAVRFGWAMARNYSSDVVRWRAFAAAHLLLLAAAAWNFHTSTRGEEITFPAGQPAVKVPVEDAVVVTDQGRIFSVFRFDTGDHTFEDRAPDMFRNKLFRVALPDLTTNCHGWVFASGRYAVPEAAVAALLDDNGYCQVASPQPNDVIVYRDEAGAILHSGRVRRVHENGQVWIESKWGPGGRYLHLPQDQCYSNSFAYYRSPRPTHDVQIVQTPVTSDARVARTDNVPLRRDRG
jgi:hypothetical protein